MVNKITTLFIRMTFIFSTSFLVARSLNFYLGLRDDLSVLIFAILITAGGIYSIININKLYKLNYLKYAFNKISGPANSKNNRAIEEDMLRAKKLLDSNIITEDEYNHKIKSLKEKLL